VSNYYEDAASNAVQENETDQVNNVGLAEASHTDPVEPEQTTRSRVSSGLIRAGIGGAVVLLAVIGVYGLVGGFSRDTAAIDPALLASNKDTKPNTSNEYKVLVTTWTQSKSQLDIALSAGREQSEMNTKTQSKILAQKKRTDAADTAVAKAGEAVADALRVSSAARDSLDDLLGAKLSRRLQAAKETLNTTIVETENAQKTLRSSKLQQQRIASTVSELKKAAKAAKASAKAAKIMVAAAQSARLVMAENEDVISASGTPAIASLESGFFKEASAQAESAGRSALVAGKAVAITEARLEQANESLNSAKAKLKASNKAEEDAYLGFAAADKTFRQHEAQKDDAQDQTEETSAALASAERRLEEKKDQLDRATTTLLELQANLTIGQKMTAQHDIKTAAAQEIFGKAEGKLRGAQRIRSIQDAAALATLNADLHDKLRNALGNTQVSQPVFDRFVLSSEALFEPGSARLGRTGRQTIAKITDIIEEVTAKVPDGMDWMLRVDGHTDATPLSGNGSFKDNWELSQARALSVVKHLIKESNVPARRMSANGFGEYQPINTSASQQAANRRIEIVLTSR